MADKHDKYVETTRTHGIIEVSERAWKADEWRKAHGDLGRAPFDNHFPTKHWLEGELSVAKEQAQGSLFRPHTDWGWYVERMLANLGLMHACRAKGEVDDACLYAVELGQLMAESRIKFEWEKDALHGRKRLRTLADSRETNNAKRAAEASNERANWQAEAMKIWKRNHSLSAAAVAKILARDTFPERSPSTIRQAIKKPDKAG